MPTGSWRPRLTWHPTDARRSPPETTPVEEPPGRKPGLHISNSPPNLKGPRRKATTRAGISKAERDSVSLSRRPLVREEAAVRFEPLRTRFTIQKGASFSSVCGGSVKSKTVTDYLSRFQKEAPPQNGFLSICLEIPGELHGKSCDSTNLASTSNIGCIFFSPTANHIEAVFVTIVLIINLAGKYLCMFSF